MASGHPSLSTMHAESVDSMMKRLETPPIELSPTLVNTLDCVAIMTHAIVKKKDTRRLREVVEIVDVKKEGSALINTPYVWNPYDDIFYYKRDSKVFEKIALKFGLSSEKLQTEFVLRAKLLYTLYKKKIFGFDQIQQIIREYYKNPERVLSRYGISV
jgi:flagellar protein FlaI